MALLAARPAFVTDEQPPAADVPARVRTPAFRLRRTSVDVVVDDALMDVFEFVSGDARRATRASGVNAVAPFNTPTEQHDLSFTDIKTLTKLFKMYDKECTGQIAPAQFIEASRSLGMDVDETQLMRTIEEVDVDGNGKIDFGEFCAVLKKMTAKRLTYDEVVRPCFDVFDRFGNGTVTEDEFRFMLRSLGGITDHRLIDKIFSEADVDGSGALEYEEFFNWACTYFDDTDLVQSAGATN